MYIHPFCKRIHTHTACALTRKQTFTHLDTLRNLKEILLFWKPQRVHSATRESCYIVKVALSYHEIILSRTHILYQSILPLSFQKKGGIKASSLHDIKVKSGLKFDPNPQLHNRCKTHCQAHESMLLSVNQLFYTEEQVFV